MVWFWYIHWLAVCWVFLYAVDIALLSASYRGLQKMDDICANYGTMWVYIQSPEKPSYNIVGWNSSKVRKIAIQGGNYSSQVNNGDGKDTAKAQSRSRRFPTSALPENFSI